MRPLREVIGDAAKHIPLEEANALRKLEEMPKLIPLLRAAVATLQQPAVYAADVECALSLLHTSLELIGETPPKMTHNGPLVSGMLVRRLIT